MESTASRSLLLGALNGTNRQLSRRATRCISDTFFDTFLAKNVSHEARVNKMENCAVVKFTLEKGKLSNGKTWYRIVDSSLKADYLSFEQKKSKKKKQ
mmetsp:Transcript_15598/g.33660  ORF Transcript_15598/g.33660 Transcript_15598/m.33660 type:complete len:98 (+) Transcript_15598:803-1096(+)